MSVSQKNEYLIWRENKGFFTAMMRDGTIQTWSLATGNKLYNIQTYKFGEMFNNFEIYQTENADQSYKRDLTNYHDKSISLIISSKPVEDCQDCFSDQDDDKGKSNIWKTHSSER